jgi:microcystin degradation protein MlrC
LAIRIQTIRGCASDLQGCSSQIASCLQIIDASVLIGYCWVDEPRSGGSVLVCGFDAAACEEEALRIASSMWERRSEFKFGVESGTPEGIAERTKEEVAKAKEAGMSAKEGLVIISDSGDNPTGGGVGDTPSMLAVLLEAGVGDAVMQGPVDAAAVEICCEAGRFFPLFLRFSIGKAEIAPFFVHFTKK